MRRFSEPDARRAAFYDVDGTLVSVNILHSYAYYAVTSMGLGSRLRRLASLAASLPVYGALELVSRKAFNEFFYKSYRGISEDRLWVLGQEVFEDVIRPALYPGVRDLIARSREQGNLQVLCTGSLQYVTAPLADYLEVDTYASNRLEMDDGFATGRLLDPVLAGAGKADWIRTFAKENNVDLTRSFAYADSFSDFPMLCSVGRPCAMHPDRKLRRHAQEHQWPVIELTRKSA